MTTRRIELYDSNNTTTATTASVTSVVSNRNTDLKSHPNICDLRFTICVRVAIGFVNRKSKIANQTGTSSGRTSRHSSWSSQIAAA